MVVIIPHALEQPGRLGAIHEPFVLYRSRQATRPNEPGTSGRRWRRIGVHY
jgi:hypothetical protein